jgi:transcriptional regulator with XRE-family HTH domain
MTTGVPTVGWREADVIHALRIECGWLVSELAARAHVNPSVLYRLEDGRTRNPTLPTLQKISQAFGLTVKELRNAVPAEPMSFATPLPVSKRAKTVRVVKTKKRA